MFIFHRTAFFTRKNTMSQNYISTKEALDIRDNLNQQEFILYATIKGMIGTDPLAEELKNPALAKRMNLSEKSIANAKSGLKRKGYLLITFSRDADGYLRADVILGKEMMTLYNLGLKVAFTSAKHYNKVMAKFPVDNPTLPDAERMQIAEEANKYILAHPEEFK